MTNPGLPAPCPRVDRHTHLEGSLDPEWVRRRARERGLTPPPALEAFWLQQALPFEEFINAFIFGCRLLTDATAAHEAIRAAVRRLPAAAESPAASRGIDLWVSPHLLVEQAKLITLEALWKGMDEGIQEARREGVHIAVILDAVNHFGVDHGHQVLDLILPARPSWVVGFSTGGQEAVPFKDWAPVFQRARKAGLRLAAHAGENGPGTHVKEAILEAGVERIVHGVRAIHHPEILELMVERHIALDVCLSSNRALVPELKATPGRESVPHPLGAFLKAGLRCALGTDDPGIIPCSLPGEWSQAKALGLPLPLLDALRENAVQDAWCLQGANGA